MAVRLEYARQFGYGKNPEPNVSSSSSKDGSPKKGSGRGNSTRGGIGKQVKSKK